MGLRVILYYSLAIWSESTLIVISNLRQRRKDFINMLNNLKLYYRDLFALKERDKLTKFHYFPSFITDTVPSSAAPNILSVLWVPCDSTVPSTLFRKFRRTVLSRKVHHRTVLHRVLYPLDARFRIYSECKSLPWRWKKVACMSNLQLHWAPRLTDSNLQI